MNNTTSSNPPDTSSSEDHGISLLGWVFIYLAIATVLCFISCMVIDVKKGYKTFSRQDGLDQETTRA
jgi:hypothetical protein